MNKNKMVREIGRRTRLKNGDVQLVLETQTIDRGENAGTLKGGNAPRYVRRVVVRGNKRLKAYLSNR